MHRILHANSEALARRKQLRNPGCTKPELLAVRLNEVWSWDVTSSTGRQNRPVSTLYVIPDIFSCRLSGRRITDSEKAALFKASFNDTTARHDVPLGQLTLHAGRGGPMKAKETAVLLVDLGITKLRSRLRVTSRSSKAPAPSENRPASEPDALQNKAQPRSLN